MVDYHVHTRLCGHAAGEVEDYLSVAVRKGLREIGFADHAPLPPSLREGLSMTSDEADRYLAALCEAQSHCADRLIVRVGFEVDFPLFDSFNRRYFTDPRIDYLIGSCHFLDGWAFDHPDHASEWEFRDTDEVYERYFDIIARMAESGLFDVIGHFDIVKKFGHRPKANMDAAVDRIARILASRGTAVEINTAGLSHGAGEFYPSERIIRILFERNVPVTFASDAHDPERIGYAYSETARVLSRIGYRYLSGFEKRTRYDIPL